MKKPPIETANRDKLILSLIYMKFHMLDRAPMNPLLGSHFHNLMSFTEILSEVNRVNPIYTTLGYSNLSLPKIVAKSLKNLCESGLIRQIKARGYPRKGGMVKGYRLTEKGRGLADSLFKEAVTFEDVGGYREAKFDMGKLSGVDGIKGEVTFPLSVLEKIRALENEKEEILDQVFEIEED